MRVESRFQTFLWWLPALVWAGVIFWMSTKTFGPSFTDRLLREVLNILHLQVSPHTFNLLAIGTRKLGHFTEYAVFSIFLYHAIGDGHRSGWNLRKALTCVLLAGLYSLTDEFHQRFVPGRGPSIVDCGFDTIGATLGMVIIYVAGARPADAREELQTGAGGGEGPSG